MFEKFLCPECKGVGQIDPHTQPESYFEECDYCLGTGYATDEDDDPMFSYEKDY